MFKDMSKIETWYVGVVTYLRRNVTLVRGASYHLLGSWIPQDSKIQYDFKSNLTSVIGDLANCSI